MPNNHSRGESLGESEARLAAIFAAEPECVKILDEAGTVLQMNPAGLGILEATSPEEVIGHSIFEFIDRADHDHVRECFKSAFCSDGFTCEFRVITCLGNRRWLESHMVTLRDISHRLEVLSVTRDVTRTRAVEKALRESEERFRLIVENSTELIAEVNERGQFLYLNPNFETALGYKPDDLLGTDAFALIHPEDEPAVRELFSQRTGSMAYRYRHRNGSWRFLESSGRRFTASSGEEHVVVISRDVTAQQEAAAAQASTEAKLRQAQKMEALGTLAGGIAHDFNNILAAIIGNIELAQLDLAPDHPALEPLQQVAKASDRAADLVRQILTFSRRKDQERKSIDVRTITSDVVKLLRAGVPSTIELHVEIQEGLPRILADPSEIFQVLMNLATNAAHAMRQNGGVLEIRLSSTHISAEMLQEFPGTTPGDYLEMLVRDTGEGMLPEVLERIFEPFFTTKPVGEGTGLGLSVVHGIVKSHDGAIFVESEVGKGTSFHLYFPAIEQPLQLETLSAELTPGKGEGVLFVDDETSICRVAEALLKRCGYNPHVFDSPLRALTSFKLNPELYSVVVTDLTMPKMTGITLAQEIKRISPKTPVILTTGFSGKLGPDTLQAYGADELLPKPFSVQSLAHSVRRVLNHSSNTSGRS